MTLQSDLIAAKALIDTPEKWVKDPMPQRLFSEGPMAMCAIRAVEKACGLGYTEGYASDVGLTLEACLPANYASAGVGKFNDDPRTTHADIMALFDRAIAATGAP